MIAWTLAPPAIGGFSQAAQGPLTDANARDVPPGFMVPRKLRFTSTYDSTCADPSCELIDAQGKHCRGNDFVRWIRYGDGLDVRVEHLPGAGCS